MPRKRIIKEEDVSLLQVRISKKTKEAFEQQCLNKGTTMSDVIREFIEFRVKEFAKED